ncbi:MAG: hypothetical protein DI526_02615 [Caulobacter segnis]|uniref:Endonuclease GajA/Old nuclease/RecF-like AAA domain-containing protein n=2 Tax=Caulobacter segnis TaxID=88688 RepID=A0A2W5VC84_9CAUL|nr:MAG: hypothetical protein DI526_02615 [Caulobacter segnis]
MNNGIARGDANLFLRNLLLRIEKSELKKTSFSGKLSRVFPGCRVITKFNEADNLVIDSKVIMADGKELPLDMVGTGMLQSIQLVAYITMYEPQLLLLDEPDAHLHPTNQKRLAETLVLISQETDTKILIATHSRHLLDAFSECEGASLFWVKDGEPKPHEDWDDVAVLMDLGALDRGERLLNGEYKYLFWTEDDDTRYIKSFINSNGLNDEEFYIFSYKASSKVDAAKLMSSFLSRIKPGVRTIIHRDRDFMLDKEVEALIKKYDLEDKGSMRLFVTTKSDIEAYFASQEHISEVMRISESDARILIESLIQENQNEFTIKFHSKRQDIKNTLYKRNPDECPSPEELIPGGVIPIEKALGKLLLKKLGPVMQSRGKNAGDILIPSKALLDKYFSELLN